MQHILRRLDSPRYALAITAILYAAYILLRLSLNGYDPSFFIVAGDKAAIPGEVPGNLHIISNSAGYDGQYYYRLALTPFTSEYREFGISLDDPPYRQQRILYPLIVWAFSLGGNPALVPSMMILVNFLALCLISWMGAIYAQSLGRHALYGALFPLFPGFVLSISRDLTEIIAALFILACLIFLKKEKQLLASTSLSLAVLTRETSILVAVCIVLAAFYGLLVRKDKLKLYLFLPPFIAFIAMQAAMYYRWGVIPLNSGNDNLAPLFSGITILYNTLPSLDPMLRHIGYSEFIFIALFSIFVLIRIMPSAAALYEKLAWLAYTYLIAQIGGTIWDAHWGFMRTFTEPYLFGTIILLAAKDRKALNLLGLSAILLSFWLAGKLINEP